MPKIQDIQFQNRFTEELPGDPSQENRRRQVHGACYSFVNTLQPKKPQLIIASNEIANTLGIDNVQSNAFKAIVSGKQKPKNAKTYAMCYGGHQFGHWAGQLGDGRAINLGEIVFDNISWTMQLKGSGPTPYSRGADGLAVLRSSVREFLCSEAMFHLGISTTRALSLSLTGERVMRDVLYDGNPAYEPGAVVCRVAESFVRFGNFELLSARQDKENLQKLADFIIKYYYQDLKGEGKSLYLNFFQAVAQRTSSMLIDWMRVGFVHGVMNTDNMSILGQTIDYGPYGWIENYDEDWTPNTTDREHRRYRFGNQGSIALWNLTQLANALYPLIEDVSALEAVLDGYRSTYIRDYFIMLNSKLGLDELKKADEQLHKSLHELMTNTHTDMTIFYRQLADLNIDEYEKQLDVIKVSCYVGDAVFNENREAWQLWLNRYVDRLKEEAKSPEQRKADMHAVNPKYVLRNYMAQLAIDEAEKGNFDLIYELHELLKRPYDEQPDKEKWFAMRPDWALNRVGCSQLSCSS